MPLTLPAGLEAELQKQFSPQECVHLFEIERSDGQRFFWATHEISVVSLMTGASQQFSPWIEEIGDYTRTRSVRTDAGEFKVQNLSGNTIERDVAKAVRAATFEGAYVIVRRHYVPHDADAFTLHGRLRLVEVNERSATFRMTQLFALSELQTHESRMTRPCRFTYNSAACGHRRGELFVPLTTADIFSASTIGRAGAGLEPDLYRDELVMILEGTGAGQERRITSHTDTFNVTPNWTTNPDGTSKYIVTGPGAMLVSTTLADIFGATTIGKAGAGWGVNAYAGQRVVVISGTGAGQKRKIASNTADTLTVTRAWDTAPDGTSRFMVMHHECARDRASCVDRGVIERFSGLIHLSAQVTAAVGEPGVRPGQGGGGGGGGGRFDDGDGLGRAVVTH